MRWKIWLVATGLLVALAVGAVAQTAPMKAPDPYDQGVREADAEWEQGDVTFYTRGLMRGGVNVDLKSGIPLQIVGGCIPVAGEVERVRGHNDQVLRLIDQRGLPPGNKRAWLPQIVDPLKYWRSVKRVPVSLQFDREVVSPDGAVRLRLKPPLAGELPKLLAAKNGKPFTANLTQLDPLHPDLQIQWGPEKSDLLFTRYEMMGAGWGYIYTALDTRTGRCLSLAWVPPAKGQP